VLSGGAGRLDIAAAVRSKVLVEPSTLSFGVVSGSLPAPIELRISNAGGEPVSLRLAVSGTRDLNVEVRVSRSSIDIGPGENAAVSVELAGSAPQPGAYEGWLTIEGGPAPLRVPYLYLASNQRPGRFFHVDGNNFRGAPGQSNVLLVFRVTDQYGVAISGAPVRFRITRGNPRIDVADEVTDLVGKAAANITLGAQAGEQEITAEVGDLRIPLPLGHSNPGAESGFLSTDCKCFVWLFFSCCR
jgi:hypothetical protein